MNNSRYVRAYNPHVLVGNWFEDIALIEEKTKDFLDRKEKGQLLYQKLSRILGNSDSKIVTSPNSTGQLKFGDRVQLLNAGADPVAIRMGKAAPRRPVVLSISVGHSVINSKGSGEGMDAMDVTGSPNCKQLSRNIFDIVSVDGTAIGEPVLYGQQFQICSCNEERYYLTSDTIPISDTKTKHRNQQVVMSPTNHFKGYWVAEFYHPKFRQDYDQMPIEVGKVVILKHAKTNQALCLEKDCGTVSLFGNEYEISAKTHYTDHKAECDINYWIFSGGNTAGQLEESKDVEEKELNEANNHFNGDTEKIECQENTNGE